MKDHVEGYLELSGKTKTYFATALSQWDADFYIKVDDDVHVNIGRYFYVFYVTCSFWWHYTWWNSEFQPFAILSASLGHVLSKLIMKPRIYIGCMKSGPVLAKK